MKQPKIKVSEAATLLDFSLFIPGNQENPKTGNPIPYHRMTQRSKWTKAAQRYLAYKNYIVRHALEAGLKINKLTPNGVYELDVVCHFRSENHGDPENIRKGIQDALFQIAGDKHVWGMVAFVHHPSKPGVYIALRG